MGAGRAYLLVLLAVAAATAIMVVLRDQVGPATVALVYLLVVFLTSLWGGRAPSIFAIVLAFLTMNFFFTVPYHTFFVDTPRDVLSLLAFVVVAEMTNRLVTRLRESEAKARSQAWEASTLHALSHAATTSGWGEQVLSAITSRVVDTLGVEECAVYLPDAGGPVRLRAATPWPSPGGDIPASIQAAFERGSEEEAGGLLALPLQAGERRVGVLAARAQDLPAETHRLLRTFAAQVALVVEQLRLHHEAAEAEALRKADVLKSALLSAVSHDFRTPLSAIRTAASGLYSNGAGWTEEGRRELLEMIDAEAARLSRLVGNLLDLTRIEGGVLRPKKEWHDISEVAARAVDHLRSRLHGHQVVLDVPADLPLVPLDFTEIEDVFVNLLENSLRYAPEGTSITLTARADSSYLRTTVANEGAPIPPEAADQIFDRFYTMAGQRHGYGIGLAICKGFVEAHGGRIWVERPGEPGARFVFTLPLSEVPAAIGTPQEAGS